MKQNMSMRDLLVAMAEKSTSDLHITAGAAPTLRVHGHLVPLDYPKLDKERPKALATASSTPSSGSGSNRTTSWTSRIA